jgi:hypothetical protein
MRHPLIVSGVENAPMRRRSKFSISRVESGRHHDPPFRNRGCALDRSIAKGISSRAESADEHKTLRAKRELPRAKLRPICSDACSISSRPACFHQEHPPTLAASRPLQRVSCVN